MSDAQPKLPSEMLKASTKDGWENTITGLGMARDKRSGGRIKFASRNTDRTAFEELFASDDLAATLAELPAREMIREWITISVDDSSNKEEEEGEVRTEDVEEKVNDAKLMMQFLDDIDAQQKIHEAIVWARVFGGALLFLGVDDGQEDLTEPLDVSKIRSFDFLTVLDRWEVHISETSNDMSDPRFGQPEIYQIQTSTSTGRGMIEAMPVHASRFIRFDGVLTSRRRMAENGGWGDSIFTKTEEVLRDFGMAWGGIAHLMQDVSQAVLKMKGLADALSSDNDNLVLKRMTNFDLCRSVARAIPIDADGEDFMRVATPLGGIPETMDRFALRLSAAARMPATLLFGQSPSGLNATGESDITFFYDQIKAMQEAHIRPAINRLIELGFLAAEGPTRGQEPENWSFEFNPLWQLTDKERSEQRKTVAETDQIYILNGVVTEDEVAMSRFGGDKYSDEMVLDTEQREEDKLLEEQEPEVPDPVPPIMIPALPGQPQVLPGEPPEPLEPPTNEDFGGFPAFFSTSLVNEHSHGLEMPRGKLTQGVHTTTSRDGHVHVIVLEQELDIGEEALLTTSEENGHTHTVHIRPMVIDASHPSTRPRLAAVCDVDSPKYDVEKCKVLRGRRDHWHEDTIEKRGNKFFVLSESGKVLGSHDTRKKALDQLAAIEASK